MRALTFTLRNALELPNRRGLAYSVDRRLAVPRMRVR